MADASEITQLLKTVPKRYLDRAKLVSDVVVTKNILRGDMTGVLVPDGGQNRITFRIPNDRGRWLICSSVELTGQIMVSATNTAGNAYNQIRPYAKYVRAILDRFTFLVGSQKLEEQ